MNYNIHIAVFKKLYIIAFGRTLIAFITLKCRCNYGILKFPALLPQEQEEEEEDVHLNTSKQTGNIKVREA